MNSKEHKCIDDYLTSNVVNPLAAKMLLRLGFLPQENPHSINITVYRPSERNESLKSKTDAVRYINNLLDNFIGVIVFRRRPQKKIWYL